MGLGPPYHAPRRPRPPWTTPHEGLELMAGLELPTRHGATAMDLVIEQGDLAYAVGKAFGSVSAKSPMPLLSCLLLEADPAGLRVTGSDLDVTTAVTVPCAVSAVGKVAVS